MNEPTMLYGMSIQQLLVLSRRLAEDQVSLEELIGYIDNQEHFIRWALTKNIERTQAKLEELNSLLDDLEE